MAPRSHRGLPLDRVRKFCGLAAGALLTQSHLISRGVWWWRQIPEIYRERERLAGYWRTFGDPDLAFALYEKENPRWKYSVPWSVACEFCHSDGKVGAWIEEWRAQELQSREIANPCWEPACMNPVLQHRTPVGHVGTHSEKISARGVFLFEANLSHSDSVLISDFRAWLQEERRRRRVKAAGGPGERRLRGWLTGSGENSDESPFRPIELIDRKTLLGEKGDGVSNDAMAAVRSQYRKLRRKRHQ